MKTKLIFSGLALIILTTLASAQINQTGKPRHNGTGRGSGYVDSNKNGMCDNYEKYASNGISANSKNSSKFFVRRNGRGKGQGQQTGQGRNGNFKDANKNGICDYYESATKN